MSNLADGMDDYLKKLLTLSASGYIEIKRKELAAKFRCVPLQVNYVLETRFTLDRGFWSRAGGVAKVLLALKAQYAGAETAFYFNAGY